MRCNTYIYTHINGACTQNHFFTHSTSFAVICFALITIATATAIKLHVCAFSFLCFAKNHSILIDIRAMYTDNAVGREF